MLFFYLQVVYVRLELVILAVTGRFEVNCLLIGIIFGSLFLAVCSGLVLPGTALK